MIDTEISITMYKSCGFDKCYYSEEYLLVCKSISLKRLQVLCQRLVDILI